MYYTGTQADCEAYNEEVKQAEGYAETTSDWFVPIEINGSWYVEKNKSHPSTMQEVNELPNQEITNQ